MSEVYMKMRTNKGENKQSHIQTEGHLCTERTKESIRQRERKKNSYSDKQIITQILHDR